VNLQQGKLSECRLKLQRGRKGVDEPFTGDGSFTGGNGGQRWWRRGKLGLERVRWCAEEAKGRARA
jgi:hypothetical protein